MKLRATGTWVRALIVGAVSGLIGVLLFLSPLGVTFEEEVGLRWLFSVRGPIEPPPDVAVVAIDGVTGQKLGLARMPRDWPRTVHARLVDSLVRSEVAVAVFDMDFSREKPAAEDAVLAEAIGRAERVVLFERLVGKRQQVLGPDGTAAGWTWIEETLAPTPVLAERARALAPFPLPKTGQAAFQFWAFKTSGGDAPTTVAVALQLYALSVYDRWRESLEAAGASGVAALPARASEIRTPDDVRALMATLRRMFQADPGLAERLRAQLGLGEEGGGRGDPAARLIGALVSLYDGPLDRHLNFYGPPGTIRTVPYNRLVEPDEEEGQFIMAAAPGASRPAVDLAERVVFVGYSDLYEPDQPDRFYTVFTGRDGIDLSGVEIMATAFANLLTDQTLRPANAVVAAGLLVLFGLLIGVSTSVLPALWAIPFTLAVATFCGWFNQMAFNTAHVWLPVATPFLVQLPLALLLGLMGQYLLGRRRQQEMTRAISYYLPAHVIKELTGGRVDPAAVDKVVSGTCFATDMSGFSTIAETKSPDELASFMNAYFDVLAQAIKRHDVDVTEFHADTIMCAWLAGEPDTESRRRAVRAALAAVTATEAFGRAQGVELKPRVGLQDGQFYLGHTGGGGRLAYSILGDPANSAARLESLNKHLGTRILVAESVVRNLDDVLLRPLGRFQLKGRAEASPVAEVLATKAGATPEQIRLCERFAEALAAFSAHEWARACALFEMVLDGWPDDGPARFYAGRCRQLVAEGDPGDDPTLLRMATK